MEQQDSTSFTGASQSQTDPVVIETPKKEKNVWKIVSICTVILVLGLGAGLTYFLLNSNDLKKDKDELQGRYDTVMSELAKYKELTGTENADEITNIDDMSVNFEGIQNALSEGLDHDFLISLDGADFKDNSDSSYQTLGLSVYEGAGYATGFTAYLYRSMTDGDWVYSSSYSGQAAPGCDDVSEEEEKAFDGVIKCTVAEE